ncbi:MAG: ribosomal-protein-alanine N-acetyltransferase, partial [Chloroflexi bacterium RBG_13_60_13]
MNLTVRSMVQDDVPYVSHIDREAFPTDWPPPSFGKELNSSIIRYIVALDDNGDYWVTDAQPPQPGTGDGWRRWISRVGRLLGRGTSYPNPGISRDGSRIVGYASLWLMVDEAHLTSIAVRLHCRRQGVGELLLIGIIKLALQMKASLVTLETRVSNVGAQALYEKYGFNRVGMRRRYYSDNGEDAVIMTTDSITSPSFQVRFGELERKYVE